MPSLDFEEEKKIFKDYYDSNRKLLEGAKDSFVALISSLVKYSHLEISKVEGRVKDRDESVKKFNRKYRTKLEKEEKKYSIKDHITDLIGLRIVCLYQDDVDDIKECLSEQFRINDITDKIAQIEKTEDSFGYKGLHLDLELNYERKGLPEYSIYSDIKFEVQIRTIIQDSWSVLDHKIKYKKSIPNSLKRRINVLAALFELADREFREIRDATKEEIEKEELVVDVDHDENGEEVGCELQGNQEQDPPKFVTAKLTAFGLLKIAKHFFNGTEFEPHKIDGFTEEVVHTSPDITRGKFNYYLKCNITKAKQYKNYYEGKSAENSMNPFTVMRHCLYLGDKEMFASILTNTARETFEEWLAENG